MAITENDKSVISYVKTWDKVPKGTVLMWHNLGGTLKVPTGWAVCDGRLLSDADVPGGQVQLPDFRNTVLIGSENGAGTDGKLETHSHIEAISDMIPEQDLNLKTANVAYIIKYK